MSEYLIDPKYLITEGDVEQKVIWPLLTNPEPDGLGYSIEQIQNKLSLKKLKLEKRNNAKLYYPDFLILNAGLPLVVIEAKKPDEDLLEGFREARLYSLEVNSLYPSELNPCKLIIACDGRMLLAGSWDSNDPIFQISIENWNSTNSDFSAFTESFNVKKIIAESELLKNQLRTKVKYRRPIQQLGGKHIQNQQIKNSFGESISIQYRHLFNPTDEAERTDVVKNAYVQVKKHQSHVDPIDRLIRKKVRPSSQDATELSDNTTPKEIITKLEKARNYNNQVLLLIGNVGSGKTTFTSYLKEVALPPQLRNKLSWVRIDLNDAPVSASEIYTWLKRDICDKLSTNESAIDIHSFDVIKEIYQNELDDFNKVALELFSKNSESYKEKLFNKIQELKSDQDITLRALIRYFVHMKGKEMIIVLDNCDKRNLEEQLLMFEVASWLKKNTQSIVFLPLRETTFDHHRHQKPLDTVVKDLIFRINPPSLEKVIYNRVKYAKRLSESKGDHHYFLPNGMKVSYPSNDELSYIRSILKSLFQNKFFKKLMTGLAGRDIRKGIEFFLDFCKSGHISEGDIFQMKQSNGEYALPNHLVSRVFIRGNRMYYSDSDSKIRNLFFSEPSDKLPDPFARVAILRWLNQKNRIKGPSGILGFHKVSALIKDLNTLGHSSDRVKNELKNLLKSTLIISESQDSNAVDIEELISINSPGMMHLELLSNIDYLSSCSEDVWYRQETVADSIAQRISGKSKHSHYSLQTTISNSMELVKYLEEYSKLYYSHQKQILATDVYQEPMEFSKLIQGIEQFRTSIGVSESKEFEIDSKVKAKVVASFDYGLICELDGTSQVGLLHISQYDDNEINVDVGDEIEVIISEFQLKHKKYKLKLP